MYTWSKTNKLLLLCILSNGKCTYCFFMNCVNLVCFGHAGKDNVYPGVAFFLQNILIFLGYVCIQCKRVILQNILIFLGYVCIQRKRVILQNILIFFLGYVCIQRKRVILQNIGLSIHPGFMHD